MTDNTVLFGLSTPVALAVLVYFVLRADRVPRARARPSCSTVRRSAGDARIQIMVARRHHHDRPVPGRLRQLRLLADGAGGGQGPNPIAVTAQAKDPALQVQVIAQQWQFTYRFPGYGGVETQHLELPANRRSSST